MSFNLYYGNDAEVLVEQLAARLRTHARAETLLEPEIILVPQFGLRRWLEIRLAEKCGILANVDFFAPAEYAWHLLRAAHPELSETSPYERKVLRWRIFAELPALAGEPQFARLGAAFADGSQSTRLRLADELAQMFERYLAYRSDMLARWERGEAKDDWQAQLWRRLTRMIAEPHRAKLLADYIRDHAATTPGRLPTRLFAFACTNISPDLLRFYGVVGRHCELDFLLPNPCREYWGDVRGERERLREMGGDAFAEDENPLLAGYGRAGRDFIGQLFSYDEVQPAIEDDLSRERRRDSLLHRVQMDILERTVPTDPIELAPKDVSLQFHVCHSRLREVQVLHDRLVDLFQRDATLTPRDVAVMAPDIAIYAPYVHAVFGGVAREDACYLPYTLSDCSARDSHPLIAFALRLFNLPLSRMGLQETLELLAEPAVLRKLELDAAQLEQLTAWLRDAGVRWGLDETQHEAFGAGRYREFTWDFGLDRLLLGFASGQTADLIAGIAPAPAIEGSDAETLGALLRGLAVLKELLRTQRVAHAPSRWQQIYNAAFDDLIDIDDDRGELQAMTVIRGALAQLAEQTKDAAIDDSLDWQCVRDYLTERLGEAERSYRFFSGGVSVCGMLPLRVVPFRIVCLIGMNDEAFPRRDRLSALDRPAAAEPRRGRAARSDRDDDRYLFLQLLTSVRDLFYLSWIGEEQRDGAAREPSAVVVELLDVVTKSYCIDPNRARKTLVVEHPLQPFSPRNFPPRDADGPEARLFTYREHWRSAAASDTGTQSLPAFVDLALPKTDGQPSSNAVVEFGEFAQFWRNPARAFFRNRLDLRLPEAHDADDDEDPLRADGLMRYQLVNALVDADLQALTADNDVAIWRARALLPIGIGGTTALEQARIPARELARVFRQAQGDVAAQAVQPFAIELPSGMRLGGVVPEHRDGLICRWTPSAVQGIRLLQAWIDTLVLATQNTRARLILLAWEKDAVRTYALRNIDSTQAHTELDRLLTWYLRGQRRPLLFFPKTSQTYAARARKSVPNAASSGAIDAAALEQACNTFTGTSYGYSGGVESADPAYALATRGIDLFAADSSAAEDFAQCAQDVYAALLQALEDSP